MRVDSTLWPSINNHSNRILETNLFLLVTHGMAEAAQDRKQASGQGVMFAIYYLLLFVVVTLDADEQSKGYYSDSPLSKERRNLKKRLPQYPCDVHTRRRGK
jgi:hypothetical protein